MVKKKKVECKPQCTSEPLCRGKSDRQHSPAVIFQNCTDDLQVPLLKLVVHFGHLTEAVSSVCSARSLFFTWLQDAGLFYISLYPTVLLLLIRLCCFISPPQPVSASELSPGPFVYTNSRGVLIWVHGFKCNLPCFLLTNIHPGTPDLYSAAHLTFLPRYLVGISSNPPNELMPTNSALGKDLLQ